MRIISQYGNIDLPYEQTALIINKDEEVQNKYCICAQTWNDNKIYTVAEYSTPEKAKKAMEMLRDCFVARYMIQIADGEARVESLAELGVEEFAKQAVFRFPQDEEIEV